MSEYMTCTRCTVTLDVDTHTLADCDRNVAMYAPWKTSVPYRRDSPPLVETYDQKIASIRAETSSAEQARAIWGIVDALRDACHQNEVRDVLEAAQEEVLFYAKCMAEEEANEESQHDERQRRAR